MGSIVRSRKGGQYRWSIGQVSSRLSLSTPGWMDIARVCVSAFKPCLGVQEARMNLRSLDLGAGECDGPPALTRRRLVPTCIGPHHPGGNSRRLVSSPSLGESQPGHQEHTEIIVIGDAERSQSHVPIVPVREFRT